MNSIFKNWDTRRFLYLLGGIFFIAIAVKDQMWWIALFGIYYISMAIFRFGCAAGNCEVNFDKEKKEEKL